MAWLSPETSFLGEMRGEITGMAITVIVIDELVGYRTRLERKQEIFEQVQSRVRDVAVEALRIAIKHGWLSELIQQGNLKGGQFEGAYLINVNLQDADLVRTNLQGAIVWNTNLQGANLRDANLQDANLWDVNLQGAYLWNANLQGAVLWDTNLQGVTVW